MPGKPSLEKISRSVSYTSRENEAFKKETTKMINRMVQLGGSSNPSLPLENRVTSAQKSFPPGSVSPSVNDTGLGVIVKFEKRFAQYLAHRKHLRAMSDSPPSLTDRFQHLLEKQQHEGGRWENRRARCGLGGVAQGYRWALGRYQTGLQAFA